MGKTPCKGLEKSFEFGALIKAFKGKFDIFGRKGITAVEFDAFAQIKAHGQVIQALPALGQAGFKLHILGIADERIKCPV
jgi:hypothetical protein